MQNVAVISVKNEDFSQVLYTAKNCQFVVMALKPTEEDRMVVEIYEGD